MSRHPLRALAEADAIAKKRGHVQHYERGAGMICDFTITIPECHAPVKIKRMRYLRCTVQWLEREAAEEIAGLRLFPSSQEISRELDLLARGRLPVLPCLRHNTYRARQGRSAAPGKITGAAAEGGGSRRQASCSGHSGTGNTVPDPPDPAPGEDFSVGGWYRKEYSPAREPPLS